MGLSFPRKSTCPCCSTKRSKSETLQLNEFVQKLFEWYPRWCESWYGDNENKAYKFYTSSQNGWACDVCIREGLVLVGNAREQEFLDWPPYFTYRDETHRCRNCEKEFLFSKEEQKYWYETLKFWVQSDAVNCKTCRAEKRERRKEIREAQKKLEKLIPKLNSQNIEELERVIELYQTTDSWKKVKHYSGILNKLRNHIINNG